MKRLYRSKTNRMFAGVLGGMSDYFAIDPTILRVIFIILLIATGVFPFLIGYIIMAFVVPEEGTEGAV